MSGISFSFTLLLIQKERIALYTTATPDASVIEKIPVKIPPRMITGRSRAGIAVAVAFPFSASVVLP